MKERRLTHHKDQCRHFIQFLKKDTYIYIYIITVTSINKMYLAGGGGFVGCHRKGTR